MTRSSTSRSSASDLLRLRAMRNTTAVAIAAMSLAACGRAPDQPAAPPAAPHQAPAEKSPGIFARMGAHHHPMSTVDAEAQRYFDQGFNFVFGFNHEEAARSFSRAAELDPSAPMPHWGIAWALGPNYNLDVDDERGRQANRAIAQAMALSKGGSDAERAY